MSKLKFLPHSLKLTVVAAVVTLPLVGLAQADTYRIGVMQALSGVGETYGTVQEKAIRMAVDEINAAGGDQFELVVEDSKCNARDAITAYTKLSQVDGIKAIVGTSCSGAALGVAPLLAKDRVVLISGSNTSPDLTMQGGPYYFRTAPSDIQVGQIGGKSVYDDGHRKIAFINAATDPSEALHRVVKRVFTGLGGEFIAAERYDTEQLEFRTLVTKVLRSKPEAIFMSHQDEMQTGNILKQIKELGYTGPLYCNDACIGTSALDIAGDAATGVIAVIPPFIEESNSKGQDFLSKFRELYGYTTLEYYMAAAYDATYLLAHCMGEIGSDQDGDALKACLHGVSDYMGAIGGPYSLGADGDVVGVTMVTVQVLPVSERTVENFGYQLR